jgi:hypothetical protein
MLFLIVPFESKQRPIVLHGYFSLNPLQLFVKARAMKATVIPTTRTAEAAAPPGWRARLAPAVALESVAAPSAAGRRCSGQSAHEAEDRA